MKVLIIAAMLLSAVTASEAGNKIGRHSVDWYEPIKVKKKRVVLPWHLKKPFPPGSKAIIHLKKDKPNARCVHCDDAKVPIPRERPSHEFAWLGEEAMAVLFLPVREVAAVAGNLLTAFREHVESIVEPVRPGYVALRTRSGRRFVIARQYAWRFAGLIRDLEAMGYPIRSIGGYRSSYIDPRYTGGRAVISRHAMGAAVDINQTGRNSVSMPLNGRLASRIAARWGLRSGGDWKSADLGHFEVASPGKVPRRARTRLAYAR